MSEHVQKTGYSCQLSYLEPDYINYIRYSYQNLTRLICKDDVKSIKDFNILKPKLVIRESRKTAGKNCNWDSYLPLSTMEAFMYISKMRYLPCILTIVPNIWTVFGFNTKMSIRLTIFYSNLNLIVDTSVLDVHWIILFLKAKKMYVPINVAFR